MVRNLLAVVLAAVMLKPSVVDARGGHGGGASHSSSSHSHSSSTTRSSHDNRSAATRSTSHKTATPHHSRSDRTRSRATKYKRDPAQRRTFMRENPCPGGPDKGSMRRCSGYRVDHIKALKHNGADRPWNMQWQTVAEAKAKDRWE
jgi:hypothetical protein